jgi:predicted SprT family Zn-dependent metalloprotease
VNRDKESIKARLLAEFNAFETSPPKSDDRPIPADIKKLYEEINRESFGSTLPDLPVLWASGEVTNVLGMAYYRQTPNGLVFPTRIEIGSEYAWTPRFLRKVMTHEMCHVWCYEEFNELDHTPNFWRKMTELGYPPSHVFPNSAAPEFDHYNTPYTIPRRMV